MGKPYGRLGCHFPPRFENSLLFSDWSYSIPHFLAYRQPANHGPLNTYNSEYKCFACQSGSLPNGVQPPTAPDSEQDLDPRCLNFLEKKKLVDFRVCILKRSDFQWASGPGQGLGPQMRVGEQRLLLGPEIEPHW